MNLLIESGATKSTCIGYNDDCTFFSYKTKGINATYATQREIFAAIEKLIFDNKVVADRVENVRYYGAGCFNKTNAEKVNTILNTSFPNAQITVLSDLYAACHALCNNNKGFVGILGTGAASCFYDGKTITAKSPSLGWLLGDEGSGTHLGKLFVTEYLKDNLALEIVQDFEKTFSVSKQIVFEKVYQSSNPQPFFSSIPFFLNKQIENKQIKDIVKVSFRKFFDKQFDYYHEIPFSWFFCGSIAFYFQTFLMEIAHEKGIEIKKIISDCATFLY